MNVSSLKINRIKGPLIIVGHPACVAAAKEAGARFVHAVDPAKGIEQIIDERDGSVRPEIGLFDSYIIALPPGNERLRDDIGIRLGDELCSHAVWTEERHPTDILGSARPMWSDEFARLDDIPDPGEPKTYETGFKALDEHGLRITLPAFAPLIGPYGSGKSVFLRQLLVNLWRKHGWKFAITAFEEKVKPRYRRDLMRHLIGAHPERWTAQKEMEADRELNECARFILRKRNTILDADRLLHLIEFGVRRHGVRVVAIDPVNEIDHQVPKGESKTDYMGRFIMRLKALADDYNLFVICCAHPAKDGVNKRLSKGTLLTLNDGADTAHWGNKADIGFVMWRPEHPTGPTILNIDKVKDHETMGAPTLAELILNRGTGKFVVTRTMQNLSGAGDMA